MGILARLALLFVIVPLLELVLLIQVGQWVGLWPTLALVAATGIAGASLARHEGLKALWRFQGELARGDLPGQAVLDGVCILLGGALLLTPGLITDAVGFSLLLPLTRRAVQRRIRRRLERQLAVDGTVRVEVLSSRPGLGS